MHYKPLTQSEFYGKRVVSWKNTKYRITFITPLATHP